MTYAADTSLTATFKVTVKEAEPVDTVPPVISGADDVAVEFGASFDPMAGVKAVDDVDGDVTGAVKVSGDTVDTSKPGAYTLVYTVSDAAGSEASVTRVATVKEKSGETPVEPGDKEPDKEPGKDTDKDGDKDDQGNKKPGLSATGASVSVVAIAAIGLLATCLWRFAAVATSKARISCVALALSGSGPTHGIDAGRTAVPFDRHLRLFWPCPA